MATPAERRRREQIRAYCEAREARQAQAELEGLGYATETASFYEENERVTLRWWLQQTAGRSALNESAPERTFLSDPRERVGPASIEHDSATLPTTQQNPTESENAA